MWLLSKIYVFCIVSWRPLLSVRSDREELWRVHSSVQVRRWRAGSSCHGGKGQTSRVSASHGTCQGQGKTHRFFLHSVDFLKPVGNHLPLFTQVYCHLLNIVYIAGNFCLEKIFTIFAPCSRAWQLIFIAIFPLFKGSWIGWNFCPIFWLYGIFSFCF